MSLLPLLCEFLCKTNVPRLRALVASAQQYHENRTALLQIDAIAGAVVNSKSLMPFPTGAMSPGKPSARRDRRVAMRVRTRLSFSFNSHRRKVSVYLISIVMYGLWFIKYNSSSYTIRTPPLRAVTV